MDARIVLQASRPHLKTPSLEATPGKIAGKNIQGSTGVNEHFFPAYCTCLTCPDGAISSAEIYKLHLLPVACVNQLRLHYTFDVFEFETQGLASKLHHSGQQPLYFPSQNLNFEFVEELSLSCLKSESLLDLTCFLYVFTDEIFAVVHE